MQKFYITGTSKGIGNALAKALLSNEENEVTGISRSNSIKHPRFKHISLDLGDVRNLVNDVDDLFQIQNEHRKIALINNAGYLGDIRYFGELDHSEFEKVFNTNVTAPAILMNAFIRQFKDMDCNKIILNIGSGAGRHPYDGWGAYCASKASIDMLSSVADMENKIRKGNVRIVSLAPGPVETGMQEIVRSTNAKDFSQLNKFIALKKSGKLPSTTEVAEKIVSFLDKLDQFEGPIQDIRKVNY